MVVAVVVVVVCDLSFTELIQVLLPPISTGKFAELSSALHHRTDQFCMINKRERAQCNEPIAVTWIGVSTEVRRV